MRRFNPEKELNKVQYGNRNKLLGIIVFLLVIIAVGSTYALYQIRHTNKLVFNTVGEFKKRDIYLSVLVDGEPKPEFPGKDDGYVFERLDCDKEGTSATFDKVTWELVLRTNKPNKCTAIFGKKPNDPELYRGLIPVTIDDDGTIKVADTDSEWYNYGEHKWANAVVVNSTKYAELTEDNKVKQDKVGETLSLETDILQMYVWIPRYKYQLFNVNNGILLEQMINIIFENGTETTGDVSCKYTKGENGSIIEDCKNREQKADNGDWYTHPAFTFKGTLEDSGEELTGIWVGKFETASDMSIIPLNNIKTFSLIDIWNNSQQIVTSSKYNFDSTKVDIHAIKNIDWGAIAYLTTSKYGRYIDKNTCVDGGCEVWLNNVDGFSGCAANPSKGDNGKMYDSTQVSVCNADNKWNSMYGRHASTTDNIYGIYDVHGSFWDLTFSALLNSSSTIITDSFDYNSIDEKYYDIYGYSNTYRNQTRGHLGDATRETLISLSGETNRWFNDYSRFIAEIESRTDFARGGRAGDTIYGGIFASWAFPSNTAQGMRIVITAKGTD